MMSRDSMTHFSRFNMKTRTGNSIIWNSVQEKMCPTFIYRQGLGTNLKVYYGLKKSTVFTVSVFSVIPFNTKYTTHDTNRFGPKVCGVQPHSRSNTLHTNRFHSPTLGCRQKISQNLEAKREFVGNKYGGLSKCDSSWTIFNREKTTKDVSNVHWTLWFTMAVILSPLHYIKDSTLNTHQSMRTLHITSMHDTSTSPSV